MELSLPLLSHLCCVSLVSRSRVHQSAPCLLSRLSTCVWFLSVFKSLVSLRSFWFVARVCCRMSPVCPLLYFIFVFESSAPDRRSLTPPTPPHTHTFPVVFSVPSPSLALSSRLQLLWGDHTKRLIYAANLVFICQASLFICGACRTRCCRSRRA